MRGLIKDSSSTSQARLQQNLALIADELLLCPCWAGSITTIGGPRERTDEVSSQHAVAFRGAYSRAPVGQGLSWSHYRVLVRVASEKQRKFYADLARKEGWTSRELQKAIATDLFDGGKEGVPQLARPPKGAFLYKVARVRVIDGDTVEALVDLGFHSFTEQRLRLAQIDAPEIQTKAGREARNFLVEALSDARTIVLQTVKTDFHGRYVAQLFCAKAEVSIDECFDKGVYLSDLLVRERHAHVVG